MPGNVNKAQDIFYRELDRLSELQQEGDEGRIREQYRTLQALLADFERRRTVADTDLLAMQDQLRRRWTGQDSSL